MAFATLALWDLRNYLRLTDLIGVARQLLPSPRIADPDRQVLSQNLGLAHSLYIRTHPLLLLTLFLGLAVGSAVILLLRRYFADRRKTEASLLKAFFALAEAVEERDGSTGQHCLAVRTLSTSLGQRLGLNCCSIRQIAMGAQLHDLGKLAVPDQILLKPGPLTTEEWPVMRGHAEIGANIIDQIDHLREAAEIVRHHHESFDGSGYPSGYKGQEIPLGARVVAVVDAYLAMTHDRPYRPAAPAATAIAELQRQAGRQFDPVIVKEFLFMLGFDVDKPMVG